MRIILLLLLFLAGCATHPIPKSKSCDMTVAGECREMSPGEKVGPGSRGHEEKPKEPL